MIARLAIQCKLFFERGVCSSAILTDNKLRSLADSVMCHRIKSVFSSTRIFCLKGMVINSVSKVTQFSGHQGSIYAIGQGSSSDFFYTGGNEGFIVEWNINLPENGKLLVKVNRPVYSFLLDQSVQILYSGTASGHLHVIDLAERKEIRNIEAHHSGIFDMLAYGQFIITAGGDGLVKIWDKVNLNLVQVLNYSNKSARTLAINHKLKLLAIGYSDYHIRVVDLNGLNLLQTIPAHNNSVFSLAFHEDESLLLSGGRDAMLKSWLVNKQFAEDVVVPAHTLHIKHIAFNPSNNLFATASMDKTIKIWRVDGFQLLKVIDYARYKGHTNSINKILWLGDETFVTVSDDKTAILWRIN